MYHESLKIKNRFDDLKILEKFIMSHGRNLGFSTKAQMDMFIAAREIVSNIIKYAYDDNKRHSIYVDLLFRDNCFTLEIEDDGKPFDPVIYEAPPPSVENVSIPVDRVGLQMVKKHVDNMEYTRKSGKNILKMCKKVG